jgi:hypothetical protein
MARAAPSPNHASAEPGYRVELPRQCDAIGMVLRDAFERDPGVPDDMMMLLRAMNGRLATSRDR